MGKHCILHTIGMFFRICSDRDEDGSDLLGPLSFGIQHSVAGASLSRGRTSQKLKGKSCSQLLFARHLDMGNGNMFV